MLLAATVGLGVAVAATFTAQALLLSQVFVRLFDGQALGDVGWLLAGLAAVLLVRPVLVLARELSVHRTGVAVKRRLRARLLGHLAALGPLGTSRTRSGQVQSLLTDGIENLEPYYGRYVPQIAVTVITVAGVTAILATVDPFVALTVAVVALLVPLLPRLWDRVLAERGHSHWSAYSALNADFVDSMQGMTTLKVYDAATRRREDLRRAGTRLLDATLGQLRLSLVESGLAGLGLVAGPALALAVGLGRVAQGQLAPEQLFLVVLLSLEAFRPFRELAMHWHAGYLGISAAEGFRAVEALTPPVAVPAAPRVLPAGAVEVVVDGVTFTHAEADGPALRGVSLVLRPGETTALVGASGSGKSTLVSLLLRFADPDSGGITVGGVDLREVDPATVADVVALVPQDPVLFSGSVADNLRAAAPAASDADLLDALSAAGALELVTPERGGLATPVGEQGALLSGGQRQRLAIARALLRRTAVLVLDEATSALDGRREAEVLDSLDRTCGTDTARLVVAHRLATVRSADRIVVLSEGSVVESGTHDELMALGGDYAAMVVEQTEPLAVAS